LVHWTGSLQNSRRAGGATQGKEDGKEGWSRGDGSKTKKEKNKKIFCVPTKKKPGLDGPNASHLALVQATPYICGLILPLSVLKSESDKLSQ